MWFRRDLRLADNAALFYALKHCQQVHCVFVFDKTILNALPCKQDRRVEFIRESCVQLDEALREHGSQLLCLHDHAEQAIAQLAKTLGADAVFANKDYEPAARKRDATVRAQLETGNRTLYLFKDQVVFEESEVFTQAGGLYSVFTPYKKAWLNKLNCFYITPYPVERHWQHLAQTPKSQAHTRPAEPEFSKNTFAGRVPTLEQLGFKPTNLQEFIEPGTRGAQAAFADFSDRMATYHEQRDFPGIKGVSYLSVHNRFGTLSIRQLAASAYDRWQANGNEGAKVWLNELIWREFYFQILFHHPHVLTESFRPEYNAIAWETGEQAQSHFQAWCEGQTGYPLVDAAMRQLNQTGYQHNRLRMVTASFLSKDLGLDWRWGERYFAETLNDYDLAANNGGWQWAASTGCDAQPWFRIFNPVTQSERFDAQGRFIRKYCPELAKLPGKLIHSPWACTPAELQAAGVSLGNSYPKPVVDHAQARAATLKRYGVVKNRKAEPIRNRHPRHAHRRLNRGVPYRLRMGLGGVAVAQAQTAAPAVAWF
ncbi:MAG: deoxyribodipyrimidine photo-lyase, partial [Limnobacter sp.]|nr:deoxyribodipyrimidine photo-lyase [Limnobacter sp.]